VSTLTSYNTFCCRYCGTCLGMRRPRRRRYGTVGGIAAAWTWLLPLPPGPTSAICCLSDPRWPVTVVDPGVQGMCLLGSYW